MKREIIIFVTIFVTACLLGCTQPINQDNMPKEISVQGFAQKGQFYHPLTLILVLKYLYTIVKIN